MRRPYTEKTAQNVKVRKEAAGAWVAQCQRNAGASLMLLMLPAWCAAPRGLFALRLNRIEADHGARHLELELS